MHNWRPRHRKAFWKLIKIVDQTPEISARGPCSGAAEKPHEASSYGPAARNPTRRQRQDQASRRSDDRISDDRTLELVSTGDRLMCCDIDAGNRPHLGGV